MHEQSETVDDPQGGYYVAYGHGTAIPGQRLPGSPTFPTPEAAEPWAVARSKNTPKDAEKPFNIQRAWERGAAGGMSPMQVKPQPADQVGATPLSWNSQPAVESALQEAKRSAYKMFQPWQQELRKLDQPRRTPGGFTLNGVTMKPEDQISQAVVANPEHRVFQQLLRENPTEALSLIRMPAVTKYMDVDPALLAAKGGNAATVAVPNAVMPGTSVQMFPEGMSVAPHTALHEAGHALRIGRSGGAEAIPNITPEKAQAILRSAKEAGVRVGAYGGDIAHQALDALSKLRMGGFRIR